MALRRLARQTVRFGIVGIAATLAHSLTVVALMEGVDFPYASLANVVGVMVGISVSYCGNYYWTFEAVEGHLTRLPRFALVYGVVFSLNGLIMLVMADIMGIPYLLPLAISLCVTPAVTFLLSRYWVFA